MEIFIVIVFSLLVLGLLPAKKKSTPKWVRYLNTTTQKTAQKGLSREQQRFLHDKMEAQHKKRIQQAELEKIENRLVFWSNTVKQILEKSRLNKRSESFKSDWTLFKEVLKRHNITKLYHFTDLANLNSIKKNGGLFSWYYCENNNIAIPQPGGSSISRELDQSKGFHNYVRVSFVKDHPMLYVAQKDGRINNPVILEIDLDVIYLLRTIYSCQNAARNNVNVDGTIEIFNTIRFSLFKKRYIDLSDEEKHYYQAEVLVFEKLPIEYITNIDNL